MPHQLIASPYPDGHSSSAPAVTERSGSGPTRYAELSNAPADAPVPVWLAAPGPRRVGH